MLARKTHNYFYYRENGSIKDANAFKISDMTIFRLYLCRLCYFCLIQGGGLHGLAYIPTKGLWLPSYRHLLHLVPIQGLSFEFFKEYILNSIFEGFVFCIQRTLTISKDRCLLFGRVICLIINYTENYGWLLFTFLQGRFRELQIEHYEIGHMDKLVPI